MPTPVLQKSSREVSTIVCAGKPFSRHASGHLKSIELNPASSDVLRFARPSNSVGVPARGLRDAARLSTDIQPPGARLAELMLEVQRQSAPYMVPALKDMRDEIVADGAVEVRRMPNRASLLRAPENKSEDCPFCRDQAAPFLVEYDYGGMVLSQNLGPYDPCSLLLRPRRLSDGGHNTQAETPQFLARFGPRLLEDLPEGVTLFSNQLAGNSQLHLHFQLVGRLVPVSKLLSDHGNQSDLDWASTGMADVEFALIEPSFQGYSAAESSHEGELRNTIPTAHLSGCLLRGSAEGVARAGAYYLEVAKDQVSDRFNLTAWRDPVSQKLVMYLVLRNPRTLYSSQAQLPHTVGALSTAGLVMDESSPVEQPQPFDYQQFVAYMAEKILPPYRAAFPVP